MIHITVTYNIYKKMPRLILQKTCRIEFKSSNSTYIFTDISISRLSQSNVCVPGAASVTVIGKQTFVNDSLNYNLLRGTNRLEWNFFPLNVHGGIGRKMIPEKITLSDCHWKKSCRSLHRPLVSANWRTVLILCRVFSITSK